MDKINVNMDGEEYIKYRESRKVVIPKNVKSSLPYFILCAVGVLIVMGLVEDLTYVPPEPFGFTEIPALNLTVNNGLIGWFAFAIGLAWIIHGFGFLIIRR